MGYTTQFKGTFKLTDILTENQRETLHTLTENYQPPSAPDSYCHWVVGTDNMSIEWDEGEKFYDYVEWLRYIISQHLIPWDVQMNGSVVWHGEEAGDVGIIIVKNNKVISFDFEEFLPIIISHIESNFDLIQEYERRTHSSDKSRKINNFLNSFVKQAESTLS